MKRKNDIKLGLVPRKLKQNAYNPAAIDTAHARLANNFLFRQDEEGVLWRPVDEGEGFSGMRGYNVPSNATLMAVGGTVIPDQFQIINQPKWDEETFTDNSTTTLDFFDEASTGIAGNTSEPNRIGNGEAQVVRAIRFLVEVATSFQSTAAVPTGANDIASIIFNGWMTLTVVQKPYLRIPLYMLPAGAGVAGALAGTFTAPASISIVSHGVPDARSIYVLTDPLVLQPNYTFQVNVSWEAVQDISGNQVLALIFDGQNIRPRQ